MPMNFVERLMAIDAIRPGVPLIDDSADKTGPRGFFDLCQALLTTVRAFGPARTLAECKKRRTDGGLGRGFHRGNVYGCSSVIFGAGNNSLSAKFEIRAKGANGNGRSANGDQDEKGDQEEFHIIPLFPGAGINPDTEGMLAITETIRPEDGDLP